MPSLARSLTEAQQSSNSSMGYINAIDTALVEFAVEKGLKVNSSLDPATANLRWIIEQRDDTLAINHMIEVIAVLPENGKGCTLTFAPQAHDTHPDPATYLPSSNKEARVAITLSLSPVNDASLIELTIKNTVSKCWQTAKGLGTPVVSEDTYSSPAPNP